MSDTNKSKSIPLFLTMLILLLVAVVGIQTWYMAEMKQTLDAMQSGQSSSRLPDFDTAEAGAKPGSETKNTVVPDENNITPDNSQPAETSSLAQPSPVPPSLAGNGSSNTTPYYAQTWSPHEEMRRMQQHMERVFNDRYYNPHYNRPDFRYHFKQNISAPEMDMREDQNKFMILVNIPGADQKDISVTLEGQRLTVSGKQEYKKQDRDINGHIIFSERRSGRFKRSITLPAPVEKKGMKMRIDNGVLRIIIPKKN